MVFLKLGASGQKSEYLLLNRMWALLPVQMSRGSQLPYSRQIQVRIKLLLGRLIKSQDFESWLLAKACRGPHSSPSIQRQATFIFPFPLLAYSFLQIIAMGLPSLSPFLLPLLLGVCGEEFRYVS